MRLEVFSAEQGRPHASQKIVIKPMLAKRRLNLP
jgi:hypothetical protein